jgi:hypothetical protein
MSDVWVNPSPVVIVSMTHTFASPIPHQTKSHHRNSTTLFPKAILHDSASYTNGS